MKIGPHWRMAVSCVVIPKGMWPYKHIVSLDIPHPVSSVYSYSYSLHQLFGRCQVLDTAITPGAISAITPPFPTDTLCAFAKWHGVPQFSPHCNLTVSTLSPPTLNCLHEVDDLNTKLLASFSEAKRNINRCPWKDLMHSYFKKKCPMTPRTIISGLCSILNHKSTEC